MHRRHPLSCVPVLSIACACGSGSSVGGKQDPAAALTPCQKEATHGHMILDYSAGISQTGTQGVTVSIVDAVPAPPALSDNVWTLKIDQGVTPLAGAKLAVKPWMTDHGHPSSTTPVVDDKGDGTYRVKVNLNMVGFWDTTITVTSGDVTDAVHFGFCVE